MNFGYPRTLLDKFSLGKAVGEGGFGSVRLATETATGKQYACKAIKVGPLSQHVRCIDTQRALSCQ